MSLTFFFSFTQRTWKMSKPWRKLEVNLLNLIKYGLYFWHKDVPLYYRIRLCEMVDITIFYLIAQFCGEKDIFPHYRNSPNFVYLVAQKGDQALNINFNHQKSSTRYYKDAGLHDQNCSTSKEIVGKGGSFTPNGFPPSGSC
ncbi:hypothetical protein Patl1_11010 [Pistacia atlantica]|uniref:Uncharacterized protein n=1 Tax=Pistacia atlantica TaxID=434234 RepID=A0ACC1A3W8_9ROSI|nr:hypothetical protein Patl1_11010 [Pistacia atlantica]